MQRLLEHFTKGTEKTVTGGQVGAEIETDFLFLASKPPSPISTHTTDRLLLWIAKNLPRCVGSIDLGRQKLELAFRPQLTFELLWELVQQYLQALYREAEKYGAYPCFLPDYTWEGDLLDVRDERDDIWVQLDGRRALEQLTRPYICSSVQFTVDVNPNDAINIINCLWEAKIHEVDYAANTICWTNYISWSKAGYLPDRFGGPAEFKDIDDYVQQLMKHDVVMHKGHPCSLKVDGVPDLDIDLFLRSIWWHYRLRRYSNTLALEVRPFSRRRDKNIPAAWNLIAPIFGL